jgi:anti-anti-sigma regulatory factor
MKGGKMALYGANPAVMEIIETAALDEIVPVAPTEAEAIALVLA